MLVLFLHCQDGGTAGNFRAVVDSPQASFSVRGRKERKKHFAPGEHLPYRYLHFGR